MLKFVGQKHHHQQKQQFTSLQRLKQHQQLLQESVYKTTTKLFKKEVVIQTKYLYAYVCMHVCIRVLHGKILGSFYLEFSGNSLYVLFSKLQ